MMVNNFDWLDSDDVVFPSVSAIAVYENDNGDIVIRQHGNMHDSDDDDTVVIPKNFINELVAAIAKIPDGDI